MRTVRNLDELLGLPRDPAVNGLVTRTPVRLEIPRFTRQALASAQDALNELQERCGSRSGVAVGLAAFAVGLVTWLQRHDVQFTLQSMLEFVATVSIAVTIGVAAKYAALAVTQWQFAYRCRAQHEILSRLMG